MSRTVYVPLTALGLGTGNARVYDSERRCERAVTAATVVLFGDIPHVAATLLAECPAGYRVALPGAVEATVAKVLRAGDEPTLSA